MKRPLDIQDVTGLIKTFERPRQLRTLVASIRKYYPTMPLVVVDDSRNPQPIEGDPRTRTLTQRFDSGLSAGRNAGLQLIRTPLTLLMDDDFRFYQRTKIELLLEPIRDGLDLCSGTVNDADYCGELKAVGGTLQYLARETGQLKGWPLYHITWNFFVARTEALRRIRWDPELKLAEHTDFFLRAKRTGLRITHRRDVDVHHSSYRSADYNRYRMRALWYAMRFMEKHGLHETRPFGGGINTLARYRRMWAKREGSVEAP